MEGPREQDAEAYRVEHCGARWSELLEELQMMALVCERIELLTDITREFAERADAESKSEEPPSDAMASVMAKTSFRCGVILGFQSKGRQD